MRSTESLIRSALTGKGGVSEGMRSLDIGPPLSNSLRTHPETQYTISMSHQTVCFQVLLENLKLEEAEATVEMEAKHGHVDRVLIIHALIEVSHYLDLATQLGHR